jgi:hypothetical protein
MRNAPNSDDESIAAVGVGLIVPGGAVVPTSEPCDCCCCSPDPPEVNAGGVKSLRRV